jgi:predicted GNAT family N-acyltransferase
MPEESRSLLAVGDAIAARLLDALAPLRFEEAADDGDRRAGYRIRYSAVVERNLALPSQFPEVEERDEADERAVHIVGWDGHRPIATCRLVLPHEESVLPVEAAFELRVPDPSATVELGRLVVDPEWRGADHEIVVGLAARGWLSMRERGLTAVLAATPAPLVDLFRDLGFAINVLGSPRRHWNELRYPFLCDGPAAALGLARRWPSCQTRPSPAITPVTVRRASTPLILPRRLQPGIGPVHSTTGEPHERGSRK